MYFKIQEAIVKGFHVLARTKKIEAAVATPMQETTTVPPFHFAVLQRDISPVHNDAFHTCMGTSQLLHIKPASLSRKYSIVVRLLIHVYQP